MKASGTKLAREKRSQHRDAKTPDILATRRRQHQLFQEVVHRLEACTSWSSRDCEAMTPQALAEEMSRVHEDVAHLKVGEKYTTFSNQAQLKPDSPTLGPRVSYCRHASA